MSRTEIKIPKKYIDKYGDKIKLWSYSKLGTYHNCKHEYYLNRILKYKSKDNIYNLCGGIAHDILEDLYNSKIEYEDMCNIFESNFLAVEVGNYKFTSDKEANNRMTKKYKDCLVDFFKTHNKVDGKVLCEREIWADINGNIFIGYVDAIHKEEGVYIITDYKTSSISEYKGKKLKEKQKQLLLYALALYQLGIPLENIKVRWNFLKYKNVSYIQKNGKIKTYKAERNKWVDAIKNHLRKEIKAYYNYEDWEAEIEVNKYIIKNSLDGLPEEIKNIYTLDDCYVYGEVSKENIEELMDEMTRDINEINSKGKEESAWQDNKVSNNDTYYCNVLCGVKGQCSYYKDYLNQLNVQSQEDEDIMKQLQEIL